MSTGLRALDLTSGYLDELPEIRLTAARRLRAWVAVHRGSVVVLGVLLPLVGVLHGWGMYRSPGISITDDEGTYVSQAWAVQHWHQLGHYTYWYDHPPLGWIQMAGYAWLTDAWARAPYSVAVGREFMLVVDVAACALLYVLARRLGLARWAAAAGVVAFAASPLSLHHHRMVWLDNVAVAWTLAALVLAASRRRSLASAVGSALCFAVAVLSKETVLVLGPALLHLLWQHSHANTRRYRIVAFTTVAGAAVLFYPLYALLKDELLNGHGHVSLSWAIRWQLHLRASNGPVLDPTSGAAGYLRSWLSLDPWLPLVGLGSALLALCIPRLRPLALGLLVQLALLLRHGYLPEAYIVSVLPFAALTIAGCCDRVVRWRPSRSTAARWLRPALLAVVVAGAVPLVPVWVRADAAQVTGGTRVQTAEAITWIHRHVRPDQRMVVDDQVWLDLVRAGYDPRYPRYSVVWFYKIGADPGVLLPTGTALTDYFVYSMDPIRAAKDAPVIVPAYEHSRIVATFGSGDNEIFVRQVTR